MVQYEGRQLLSGLLSQCWNTHTKHSLWGGREGGREGGRREGEGRREGGRKERGEKCSDMIVHVKWSASVM